MVGSDHAGPPVAIQHCCRGTVCFMATSLVINAANGRAKFAEMTVLCFAAFLGPALVAWKWPSDTAPAMAAAE